MKNNDKTKSKKSLKNNARMCVSCRKLAPKENFWRVVRLHREGQIQLDRGLGRSAYICPTKECLTLSRQKNRLKRSLKTNVPDEIYDTLDRRLSDMFEESPLPQ